MLQSALEKQASQLAPLRTPTKGKQHRVISSSTPSTKRSVLTEMAANESTSQALPAPTPGQPRKASSRPYAPNTASRRERPVPAPQSDVAEVEDPADLVVAPARRKKAPQPPPQQPVAVKMVEADAPEPDMSEEEYLLRLHRRTTSRSPAGKRSVSYTTTTTTTVSHTVTPPSTADKSIRERSGSGIGVKVRSSPRRGTAGGVRKVSGRVVSGGGPKA